MSVFIGQSPQGYRINNQKNTIIINSVDEENKTLIKLNANEHIIQETYIQIGSDIKFGSSNNLFVIKDKFEQNLLNLDTNIIKFNQEVLFENNINIFDNIYVNENTTSFYKDVHFHLEQNEIISVNNDVIQIHNDHVHTKNLISSNLIIENSIKTNRIYPISSNIIIEGLLLEDYRALNGTFKNNMIIDYNQLGNSIPENVTSITINKLQNTCNFINLYEENNTKFAINNNGYIDIGDNINHNIPININSIEDNIIKINDVFNVNKIGGLSLGKVINNKSLLNIHRNDTNIQNNILNDSLTSFSMDYNPLNNYITSNIEYIPFYSSNIIFNIIKENDTSLNLSLEFSNVNPEHQIKWNSDGYGDINYQDDLNEEIGLILRWNLINYNDYHFKYYDLIQNPTLKINSSNIRLITGLWKLNEDDMEKQMNELIINTSLTNSNYELIKINKTEAINEYFAGFDNYNLNIELNIIIEKLNYIPTIQYINTIPQLQSPPNFIDFHSNNDLIGYIDGNGLFEINDIKVINQTTLNDVSIQKLTHDIDFDNNNQKNVKNIDVKNIYVEDTIYIGDIIISKTDGIVLGDASVENQINSIDICNLNSKYLKYNDESISILNKLNIGSNLNTLNTIRQNNSLYNIIIADESIYMQNGNITINGSNSYINIHSYKTEYKQRNDPIDNDNVSCLTTYFDSNVFSRNYNDLNLLSFGNNDFVCIDTQKSEITIGIPKYFFDGINGISGIDENWYKYYNDRFNTTKYIKYTNIYSDITKNLHKTDSTYLNHTATIYGGTRFADKMNYTLAEIRDDNETSTLRVYGNIKCSKARNIPKYNYEDSSFKKNIIFSEDNEALYVDGDAKVDGKIYSTGGVVSLSDRNVKTEIKIIQNSIEKIKQISGYTYYRTDLHKNDTGLIAQEVEQIFPEIIEENNKLKSISYGNLTGLLVEAIKNINNRLEKIEKLMF
jgi:hypothetical protein